MVMGLSYIATMALNAEFLRPSKGVDRGHDPLQCGMLFQFITILVSRRESDDRPPN